MEKGCFNIRIGSAVFALLVALMTFAVLPSYAGSYVLISMDVGSTTANGRTQNYLQTGSGCEGYAVGPKTITATGAITSYFGWAPDYDGELPPKSVIVQESCSAYAEVDYTPPYIVSANNGLGAPQKVGYGSYGVASAVSTRYKVINGDFL